VAVPLAGEGLKALWRKLRPTKKAEEAVEGAVSNAMMDSVMSAITGGFKVG
jgi:hypothetical protein